MSQVNNVEIEISVLLGRCVLPMHQLLRMGRGAVIPLDTAEGDQVWVLANNHPIAKAEIAIEGDRVAIELVGPADVNEYNANN